MSIIDVIVITFKLHDLIALLLNTVDVESAVFLRSISDDHLAIRIEGISSCG